MNRIGAAFSRILSAIGLGSLPAVGDIPAPALHQPAVPRHHIDNAMKHGAARWANWALGASDRYHHGKGSKHRAERRRTGITARQQRLRRQHEAGKPHDRIYARRVARYNRQVTTGASPLTKRAKVLLATWADGMNSALEAK